MFGVIRPCRHGMCASLFDEWLAHLCGLCLTLRAEHGQAARLVTNYDGLLVSVLVAAQAPEQVPYRTAGRCADGCRHTTLPPRPRASRCRVERPAATDPPARLRPAPAP